MNESILQNFTNIVMNLQNLCVYLYSESHRCQDITRIWIFHACKAPKQSETCWGLFLFALRWVGLP